MPVSTMSRRVAKKRSPWPDNIAQRVVFSITNTSASNDIIQVTLSFRDAQNNVIAEKVGFFAWLSSDAAGLTLATAPTGNVTMNSGMLIVNNGSGQSFQAVSTAAGAARFVITDSGTPTMYLNVRMPDGSVWTSDALTFA